jgi:thioredoxin-related protein
MGKVFLLLLLFAAMQTYAQQPAMPVLTGTDTVVFYKKSFDSLKVEARAKNKPYMLVFGASWCQHCKRVKTEVFTNQAVAQLLNTRYLVYYVDLESFDGLEVNNEFEVKDLPTIKFFDAKGNEQETIKGYFDNYYLFRKLKAYVVPTGNEGGGFSAN